MTDSELIAKKLGEIETCVRDLRTLARPEEIRKDIREQRFVEHTLQLAIQAALDAASHIVSDERLGEPRTNRELFDLLERGGWVAANLDQPLRNMVGFRNVLVHGYDTVDLANVEDVVRNRLGDLLDFVAVIRPAAPTPLISSFSPRWRSTLGRAGHLCLTRYSLRRWSAWRVREVGPPPGSSVALRPDASPGDGGVPARGDG